MAAGDRLRVERRLAGSTVAYMHHGIDAGDGTVVHARPDDFRNPLAGGRVERTSLMEFAGGGAVLVTTEPAAAYPPHEIVARAVAHVGREGYCPVVDNCEHFATWCATGERSSRQVDIVLSRLSGAAARIVAAVSARRMLSTAAVGAAERIAMRTALGIPLRTTVRLGLRTLVPAAIAGEAAALAAEWTAHHAGRSAADSRRAGEAAGLAASAAACGLAGLPAGPGGVIAGALAGAAVWAGGGLATNAATRIVRGQPRSR
jgi:hypothetical protein